MEYEGATTYVKDTQNWRMQDFNVSIMKWKSLEQTNKQTKALKTYSFIFGFCCDT